MNRKMYEEQCRLLQQQIQENKSLTIIQPNPTMLKRTETKPYEWEVDRDTTDEDYFKDIADTPEGKWHTFKLIALILFVMGLFFWCLYVIGESFK